MDYRVLITPDAENDLEEFVKYLVIDKKNKQAAENLLNDFELTLENLERVAGSLRYCDNPRLSELGYKKNHFLYPAGCRCASFHLHQKTHTYNIALEMARKKLVC